MNKKVLTLCAGVLLVGGSAVFTVNAVNAGNGQAPVAAYVAQAEADAAGYNLVNVPDVTSTGVAIWSVDDKNHLSPKEGWYVAADGSIVNGVENAATVSLKDGYVLLDGEQWNLNVSLWNGEDVVEELSELSGLTLATSKIQTKELSDQTIAAFNGSQLTTPTYDNVGTNVIKWTLTDDNHLTITSNGQTASLMITDNGLSLAFPSYEDGNPKALVDYVDGQLQLITMSGVSVEKAVPLYIASTGLTTNKDAEGAEPAVLYSVDENNKATLVEEVEKGKEYVIAQGIKETVMGDTKYSISEIDPIEAGAAGAEYGIIPGVKFTEDGTLEILQSVSNVEAPVYIYYEVEDVKYYLTPDKTWSKDIKTAWVLEEGDLKTIAETPQDIEGISYTPTGISGVEIEGDHQIVIELAQISKRATEFGEGCENYLMAATSSDYVYVGGYYNGEHYFFKKDGKLTKDISEAELWKVDKTTENKGRYGYTFLSRTDLATGTKTYLKVDGATRFTGWNYNYGTQLVATDNTITGPLTFTTSGSDVIAEIDNTGNPAIVIGLYESSIESFSAQWLVHRYGSSFKLNFTNHKDYTNKTWIGNVFEDADLVPVLYKGGFWWNWDLTEILPENDWRGTARAFLLKDRNSGLYIALNIDDNYSNTNDFVEGGYPFELLSESNIEKVLRGEKVDGKTYYPYFRVNYQEGTTEYLSAGLNNDNVKDDTAIRCIEVGNSFKNFPYDIVILETDDRAGNGHKNLFVTVESKCAHKHNDSRKPIVTFYTDDENIVRGEDSKNNPLNDKYVNITFKAGSKMQFKNENDKMVNLNGKVMGLNSEGKAEPTEPEYFLFDKAEGQWIVTMTDAGNITAANKDGVAKGENFDSRRFTFKNRENGASFSVESMHALGNDTYAVEYDKDAWGQYLVNRFGQEVDLNLANRDTLIIKAADIDNTIAKGAKGLYNTDSYANWTKEELQDKTFQLSVDAAAQLYVTENEGKDSHFLGLTADETEVTNWRLVPFTAARQHDKDAAKYLTQGTDSVYIMAHPQYYSGGKFYAYNDTTAIVTYALQNIQNNEWLTYDPSQNQTIESMICDPNSKNYTTANLNEAYRFVLKEKAEGAQKIESGAYNIIGVTPWGLGSDKYVELNATTDKDGNTITGEAYYELNLTKKLYGATSYQNLGAIEVENAYVQPTSNDIFTIATTASQEYVKATPRDTVRIFGAEENDFLLYEKGQFLNMGNKAGIAPAMVLDTAYYSRTGNNRYQYLIVVNPDYKPEVPCDIEGHPALHPDTMYGRFLVNKIDSAVLASRSHNNRYINDIEADEKELKLGFQWGYRTGDKLYLTAGKGGKVIETIDLSTPDFNKAKFAFKYVNEAVDKQFKVQTAWYDYDSAVKAGLDNKDAWTWNNEGYLRSVNGVIVVTNGYTHGEEFLMAQENSDPTANESINASSVVVAGVDGAVVVKGAEGKNVIVSTILGKVVANETVSSDNATIAAPQGVVVVSVDGESFKVVVK